MQEVEDFLAHQKKNGNLAVTELQVPLTDCSILGA